MAKIGFIGMGNMGSAILNGLLRVYKPEDLLFTAAHKEKMEAVTAKTGVPHAVSNAECVKKSEYVILAVKPQYFETVFEEIRPVLKEDQIVISLAPGQTIASLTERLDGKVRIVRTMPNTPALLGEGMTGMAYEESRYNEEEKAVLCGIFEACGRLEGRRSCKIWTSKSQGIPDGSPDSSRKRKNGTGNRKASGSVKGRGMLTWRYYHCWCICTGRVGL